ncbi:MAG: hypothetical protein ABR518_07935 [Actinomycetota bacterium]
MTRTRKLVVSVVLFAVAVAAVFLAGAVERAWPLFVAWVPLFGVVWTLLRPEPGEAVDVVAATPEPAPRTPEGSSPEA